MIYGVQFLLVTYFNVIYYWKKRDKLQKYRPKTLMHGPAFHLIFDVLVICYVEVI